MKTVKLGAIVALLLCLFVVDQEARAGLAEGVAALQKGDYVAALKELTPEAERGNAEAQLYLGDIYDNGKGVEQDAVAAFKWNQMAANQGNHKAEENLGLSYLKGRGVAKDATAAMKWLETAANGGNASAQYQIASMYNKGEGVAQNSALAMQWLRKSADGRNALALNELGSVYQSGTGVKADKLLALALYNLSNFSTTSSPNNKVPNSFVMVKDLTAMEVKDSWNVFCVLGNSKSLIGALDAYVANPKSIPANACASNQPK